MNKNIHYIIENKIITNIENKEDFIELFNKKLATIILNIELQLSHNHSLLAPITTSNFNTGKENEYVGRSRKGDK